MPNLISIEIQNYRSFYTRQKLDLGSGDNREITAIYGPNSGGKSNSARALSIVQHIITNSASANWILPYDPFLLRESSDTEPTFFSLEFEHSESFFSYSFSYDSTKIILEELKERSKNTKKMKTVFRRNELGEMSASARKFGFGSTLTKKTRKETLLITKGREDNNRYSNIVFDVIGSFNVIPGDAPDLNGYVIELLKRDPSLKDRTIALMRRCDFAIRDIELVDVPITDEMLGALPIPDEVKKTMANTMGTTIRTAHAIRDSEKTVIGSREFDFWGQESMGTRKFLEMAVPIVDALANGKLIYIDEFGAFLHNSLTTVIVRLFKDDSNIHGAKLVLNTHNVSVMAEGELAREDIVFIEKNHSEESVVVPLLEKSVREGEAFEKRYREGLYGAVPIIRERA